MQRLCERTRIVGKDWNGGWNKVLATAFVNQIIAYIYTRYCRKKKRKEGGGRAFSERPR